MARPGKGCEIEYAVNVGVFRGVYEMDSFGACVTVRQRLHTLSFVSSSLAPSGTSRGGLLLDQLLKR